ncbi:hypothetical protein [Nonlabens xiamenensis]|uniref:hypothetical protein n=1 Tax=Nonlabens xiamenensis TaxID=2341043 RepID=UPI000F6134F5|nr:hypothetical protein [Nonlabens xiamenensis]
MKFKRETLLVDTFKGKNNGSKIVQDEVAAEPLARWVNVKDMMVSKIHNMVFKNPNDALLLGY